MTAVDLPPIRLPPKPAIIRPAEQRLLRPGFLPATVAERRAALAELISSGRISKADAANALVLKLSPISAMLLVTQLSGFGGSKLASLDFVASGTANNVTITIPAGFTGGDLCVIFNSAVNSSSSIPTAVTPTNFSLLQNNASTLIRGIISAKILTGAESTLTGMNGTQDDLWIAAVWRPNAPIGGFTWNSPNGQGTAGDPASQTIAATGATSTPILLLGQMGASGASTIDPRSTSPTMNEIAGTAGNAGRTYHFAHWFTYQAGATPANHSYDMGDHGQQIMQSGFLSFAVG